jgi:pimeloyl-ACP methyl ester carboxylesterase
MPRKSSVITQHDAAGDYEVEIFDHPNPKRVIVCSHGRGVRRWDGEKFFYVVAEHYADSAVLLVDQNQLNADSIRINPLPILVKRVRELIEKAKQTHPETPIVIVAHSFGCGVASFLGTSDVSALVLVTPTVGTPFKSYTKRYGKGIINGKTITTIDGLKKEYTADFMNSVKDISWENEYAKLIKNYAPTYVFEAGEDEIIGEERSVLRNFPFTSYDIIHGAKHNLSGVALTEFFSKLDTLV